MPHPLNRYRPAKVSDGAGGFAETRGAALVIFGTMSVHQNKTTLLVDHYDDVKTGDHVGVKEESASTEAFYRVVSEERLLGTRWRSLTVERIDRPIAP